MQASIRKFVFIGLVAAMAIAANVATVAAGIRNP